MPTLPPLLITVKCSLLVSSSVIPTLLVSPSYPIDITFEGGVPSSAKYNLESASAEVPPTTIFPALEPITSNNSRGASVPMPTAPELETIILKVPAVVVVSAEVKN